LEKEIFSLKTDKEFNDLAIKIFQFQYEGNSVYRQFVDLLNVHPGSVGRYEEIPFLPIEFFKTRKVVTGNFTPELVFKSSGTTSVRSTHFVRASSLYRMSFIKGFEMFYGKPERHRILALLPSYQIQGDSSLVYMVDKLINRSTSDESGFFLNQDKQLAEILSKDYPGPTLLIGVSYALLDFCEKYPQNLPGLVVMETGGMKGRRKEMTRPELHGKLKKGFGVDVVHSEYGMTELLSQAYAPSAGIFKTPPWMRMLIRDVNDPLAYISAGRTGGINIIDLANLNSCSFIATSDLGRKVDSDETEILGRFDFSDTRGCNLMVSEFS
jgi:hypothetical protein